MNSTKMIHKKYTRKNDQNINLPLVEISETNINMT